MRPSLALPGPLRVDTKSPRSSALDWTHEVRPGPQGVVGFQPRWISRPEGWQSRPLGKIWMGPEPLDHGYAK